jgi:hypothetical protein
MVARLTEKRRRSTGEERAWLNMGEETSRTTSPVMRVVWVLVAQLMIFNHTKNSHKNMYGARTFDATDVLLSVTQHHCRVS